MKRFFALLLLLAPLTLTAHITGTSHFDWVHSGLDVSGSQTNVAGFTLYCGQQSGVYTENEVIPDGDQRSLDFAVMGLTDGDWYCALTASNAYGTESARSNEVLFPVAGGAMIDPSRVPAPAAPSLSVTFE